MIEAAKVPERLGRLIVSPKAYAKQNSLLAGFRWLRTNLPLGRVEVEGFDPFWVVTKHADILEIIRQHNLFHNGDRAHTLVPRASDETARALTGGSPLPVQNFTGTWALFHFFADADRPPAASGANTFGWVVRQGRGGQALMDYAFYADTGGGPAVFSKDFLSTLKCVVPVAR